MLLLRLHLRLWGGCEGLVVDRMLAVMPVAVGGVRQRGATGCLHSHLQRKHCVSFVQSITNPVTESDFFFLFVFDSNRKLYLGVFLNLSTSLPGLRKNGAHHTL